MAGFKGHYYRSEDGLTLYYRVYPAKQVRGARKRIPVICLPGLTRNSRDFDTVARQMACERSVLTLDFRGRGRSDHDPDPAHYMPQTYVRDLLTLLDLLELDQVVCLGTSLGGIVSMLLAAQAPERVSAVMLNDVGAVVEPAGLARIAGYAGVPQPVRHWAEAVAQTRAIHGRVFPGKDDAWWRCFTEQLYREQADGVPVLDYDANITRALDTAAKAVDPEAGWSLFRSLQGIPTLLIRGEQSDILSEATATEMKRQKPDLQLCQVLGVGHAPALDEPEALSAIDGFLAGC